MARIGSARSTVAGLVVATALLTTAVGCHRGATAQQAMPRLTVQPLDHGTALDVGAPARTPSVVNLWATWCGPCRAELPAFQRASDVLADRVRFVGIDVGERDTAASRTFLDGLDVTFPQYRDPSSTLSERLGVSGLPTTLLVDRRGRVVEILRGKVDEVRIEHELSTKLGVTR